MRTRILLLFACSLVFAQPDANPQQQTPPEAYNQQNASPVMYGVYAPQSGNENVAYGTYAPNNEVAEMSLPATDSIAAERAKEDSLKNVVRNHAIWIF